MTGKSSLELSTVFFVVALRKSERSEKGEVSGGEAGRRLDSSGFDRSVSTSFGAIVLWPGHFGSVLARWVGG